MANLNTVRRRLATLLVVLGVADVAAVTYLVLPSTWHIMAPDSEERDLEKQLKQLRDVTNPLRDIDKKIDVASNQINTFKKDRLPDRYSSLVEELGKLAAENKVQLSSVRYKTDNTQLADITDLNIQAELAGDYENLARFINSVERDQNVFFIIDSVDLAGGKDQSGAGGTVRLSIKFETFLRNQPAPETASAGTL
jgi:Tfp pilus assembly protein PilO